MSRTKAFLFDRLPEDEPLKSAMSREWRDIAADFTVRTPTRRKNPQGQPRWDPLWRSCLHDAAQQLGTEVIQINDGLHLRTTQDRDAVVARAEVLLLERRTAIFGKAAC